jgi:acyl-CoA hydrolase
MTDLAMVPVHYAGLADLRAAPVTVRYEQMLAVAHPEHRAALAAELEEHLMNGALR